MNFLPEDKKTIGDICRLIAAYAIKNQIEAKQILGANCLAASVFLELKERLETKGVDTENLRPSSEIAPYLSQYFSPIVEEITLTGVRVFDKISYATSNRVGNIKLSAGSVITFRDVVNRICEGNKLPH